MLQALFLWRMDPCLRKTFAGDGEYFDFFVLRQSKTSSLPFNIMLRLRLGSKL
jgi:hypothetical protein